MANGLTPTTAGWLKSSGVGLTHGYRVDAFHLAMFEAYFVEGQNIGDMDVLVQIAQAVGLPAEGRPASVGGP